MKKILVLLGALAIVASSSATLISCGLPARWFEEDIQHDSLDDLRLDVDFDDAQKSNYDYIKEQVDQLINEINPLAKSEKDYIISNEGFNLDGKVKTPGYIQVSATENSKRLEGSFNVRVYKDFNRQIAAAKLAKQGTFAQGEEVKKAIQRMLEQAGVAGKENTYYKFEVKDDNPGSWSIHSIGTDSVVEINFSFEQTITAFNLNTLNGQIPDFKVQEKTMDDLRSEVATLITSQRDDLANVQEGVDYEIKGDPSLGSSSILVKSIGQDNYLTGSFTIKVLKETLDGFDFKHPEANILMSKSKLDQLIQTDFKAQFKNLDLVLNTDYKVEVKDNNLVEVSALENSDYLTGGFSFQLNKVSLTEIGDLTWNDLTLNSTVDQITKKVLKIINDKLIVNGVQVKEVSEADLQPVSFDHPEKLTFNANPNSLIIKDSLTVSVHGVDISTISLPAMIVGQQSLNSLKTEVVNKINASLPNWASKIVETDLDFNEGTTNAMKAAGTITISPKPTASQLTGMLSIIVSKKDISPLANVDPVYFSSTSVASIKQVMLDQINQVLEDDQSITLPIQATVDDFEILDSKNQPVINDANWTAGNFTLKAKESSSIITGEIKLIVDKYDITKTDVDSILVGSDVNNKIASLIQEIKDKFPLIQEHVDYEINNPTNEGLKPGTVTIQSLEDSTYLTGSISFKVEPMDLSLVKLDNTGNPYETTRNNLNEFKTLFANKVNQLFIDEDSTIKLTFGTDYDLFDQDGNQVIDNEQSPYAYPKGQYFVKPINQGLDYFKNFFELKINPTNLNNGEKIREFVSGIDSVETIKNEIHDWVNTTAGFAGTDFLKEGVDYEIKNNKGNPTDLERSGPKWVRLIRVNNIDNDNDYITGGQFFDIRKYDLKNDGFTDIDLKDLTGKLSEIEITNAITKALNKATHLNNKIKYNIDFTLNPVDQWITEGITITTTEKSAYISGTFHFELKPVSLKDINDQLQTTSLALNDNYQNVENNIDQTMSAIFENSVVKPVLTTEKLKGDYYVTGKATQLVDNQLVISGPDALILKAEPSSKLFVDQASLEVQAVKTDDGNDLILESTGSNYLLTPTSSTYLTDHTYGANWTELEDANPETAQGVIKKNEILGISRYFLVTSRGIFVGPNLIQETTNLNLKYEDLISITDSFVLTTKGSWYFSNVTKDESRTWTAKTFDASFNASEILAVIDENTIVTTNGVYQAVRNGYKVINEFSPITLEGIEENTITKDELLGINSNFIITKKGIWQVGQGLNKQPFKRVLDISLQSTDILEFSSTSIAIKNYGIISWITDRRSNQTKLVNTQIPNFMTDEKDFVAKSQNYFVTKDKIYWGGAQIDSADPIVNDLTSDDIIAINDDFLVTKDRIYYQSNRIQKPGGKTFNFVKDDFLYANERFLVMKQGIHYEYNDGGTLFGNFSLTATSPNTTVKNTDLFHDEAGAIAGITRTYVSTKLGTWYREPGGNHGITKANYNELQNLKEDSDFIIANDYYLVTRMLSLVVNNSSDGVIRFGKNTGGRPAVDYNLFTNLTKDDILGLKGPILLFRNKGFYYYRDPFWTSEGINQAHTIPWKQSDIIRIGDQGQILTKYKTWKRWSENPTYVS